MVFLYKKRQKQFYSNCVVYSYAAFSSFGVSVGSSISAISGDSSVLLKMICTCCKFYSYSIVAWYWRLRRLRFRFNQCQRTSSLPRRSPYTLPLQALDFAFARFCGGNVFDCIEVSCKSCYIRHFVVDVCSIRRVTSVIKLYSHIYIAEAICYAPWQWLW